MTASGRKATAAYVRFLREKRAYGFGLIARELRMQGHVGADEEWAEELYEYAQRSGIRAENNKGKKAT